MEKIKGLGKTVSAHLNVYELQILFALKEKGIGTTQVIRRGLTEYAKENNIELLENNWHILF